MSDLKVDGIIASTGSNTNLTLQGKGTGKVAIGDGALLFPDADGSANQVIATNASAALSFITVMKADVDTTLTAGFAATADADGTKTTGTYTPTTAGGNYKTAVNGGAHTLAPQTSVSTIVIQYTNDSSAGSITTSGWDIVTGDSLTTTNGDDFMCYLTVIGAFQHLHVVALQ